ncbi:discoidin domain-containing protein [Haliscomenobacter sp.]|uniref:galactose-binding domain-containing protein n=1 Tax=Haliscomenobacter sp. TaxID=2717303 RepID=UPI003BAD872C
MSTTIFFSCAPQQQDTAAHATKIGNHGQTTARVYQKRLPFSAMLVVLIALLVSGSVMGQTEWPAFDQNNIAQFKPTKQSSTFEAGHANRAVDGNTDGDWGKRTVSHTNDTPNPWWEVNLLGTYDITSITIHNRNDVTERLNNFSIRVSSVPFTSNTSGEVFADKQPTFKGSKTITGNKRGQYIRIYLNQPGILSLAEVVVNGKLVNPPLDNNLALGKPARQSSVFDFSFANRANDGDISGRSDAGSISHTEADNQTYWEVDLGKNYLIDQVKLFNRTDCCQDRLNNFNIWVTPYIKEDVTSKIGAFAENEKKFDGPSKIFTNKKVGRYVRVELNDRNYLNLAEVQVFGSDIGELTPGQAESSEMYQVSIFRNLSPTANSIKSTRTTSISEGMDFNRTVHQEDRTHWSLTTTAKATVSLAIASLEFGITTEVGIDHTNGTQTSQGRNVNQTTSETLEVAQDVPGGYTRYEFHKFVLNQTPMSYKFNGETYSWYRINEKATPANDITVMLIPNNMVTELKATKENWVLPVNYKRIIEAYPNCIVRR